LCLLGAAGQAALTLSPAKADPPPVQLDSRDSENHLLQLGNDNDAYWVSDGPWGANGVTEGPGADQYEERIGVYPPVGPRGEVAFRTKWRWPRGENEVKGYPAIISGRRPGYYSPNSLPAGQAVRLLDDSISASAPSGATPGTFLPLQLPINSLVTQFNFSHLAPPTGAGQLTYDIWLQSSTEQRQGFGPLITHEIMIPLDNWGGYGSYPNGRNPAWYDHDVTIDGRLYHVYAAKTDGALLPNFQRGWKFIVFQPDVVPVAPGQINLAAIVNYIATRTDARGNRWAAGNEYLVSVELGVEPVEGTGDIVVYDYKVSQAAPSLPPGPAQPSPTTRVQAEDGVVSGSGVSARSDIAGYEGSGFVGSFTDAGDRVTVHFPNMKAGTYEVRIRYHSGGPQQNLVQINNGQLRDVSFTSTGSNWAVKSLKWVTLADGANTVAILKGYGYFEVDYVEIVPMNAISPMRIQAENGTLTGVTINSDVAGYEGAGFVGPFTNTGDKVSVTFRDVPAGTYDIRIRHNGSFQQNFVSINGALRDEGFAATGPAWGIQTLPGVTLTGGANTISVIKGWGWINVDYIEIVPATAGSGISTGPDGATRIQAENGALTGVLIKTGSPAGYDGSGFAGPFSNQGDQVAVTFNNVLAGTYDIRIRHHGGIQQNTVAINGAARSEGFPDTGGGWGLKTLSGVTLAGGPNTISVIKDWGWLDVDYIEIFRTGP
jgi:hypothetical protein